MKRVGEASRRGPPHVAPFWGVLHGERPWCLMSRIYTVTATLLSRWA